MKTKDIAEDKLGYSVVYGDTDSIFINTGTNNVKDALEKGHKLKVEINVQYKCLEIEVDGVFKSLLLLKKKKYAALKIENPGKENQTEVKEVKGLDLVRRDWCSLSKRVGNYVLDQVMSGKPKEEIQLALNDFLSDIGQRLKNNQLNISEYIITK